MTEKLFTGTLSKKLKENYLRLAVILRFQTFPNGGRMWQGQGKMSLVMRKPVFGVSDQVPHKPDCTATEDG